MNDQAPHTLIGSLPHLSVGEITAFVALIASVIAFWWLERAMIKDQRITGDKDLALEISLVRFVRWLLVLLMGAMVCSCLYYA